MLAKTFEKLAKIKNDIIINDHSSAWAYNDGLFPYSFAIALFAE